MGFEALSNEVVHKVFLFSIRDYVYKYRDVDLYPVPPESLPNYLKVERHESYGRLRSYASVCRK